MSELSDAKALEVAQTRLDSIKTVLDEFTDKAYDPDYNHSFIAALAMFTLGQITSLVVLNDDDQ